MFIYLNFSFKHQFWEFNIFFSVDDSSFKTDLYRIKQILFAFDTEPKPHPKHQEPGTDSDKSHFFIESVECFCCSEFQMKSSHFSKLELLLVAAALACQPTAKGEAYKVDFSQLPQDDIPAWRWRGIGEATTDGTALRLQSGLDEGAGYILEGGPGDIVWDGDRAAQIDFEARAVELPIPDRPAAHVIIHGNGWRVQVPIDHEDWRHYTIILDGQGGLEVHLDGVLQNEYSVIQDGRPQQSLSFGDLGRWAAGTTEWRLFKWEFKP